MPLAGFKVGTFVEIVEYCWFKKLETVKAPDSPEKLIPVTKLSLSPEIVTISDGLKTWV